MWKQCNGGVHRSCSPAAGTGCCVATLWRDGAARLPFLLHLHKPRRFFLLKLPGNGNGEVLCPFNMGCTCGTAACTRSVRDCAELSGRNVLE